MLNDKVMLEVFWNESGSFLVDVPRDKEEEFCSYWNNERYDMSPQLYEFHYGEEPTEFEVYLKEIGGEVIGGNQSFYGKFTGVEKHIVILPQNLLEKEISSRSEKRDLVNEILEDLHKNSPDIDSDEYNMVLPLIKRVEEKYEDIGREWNQLMFDLKEHYPNSEL